jgi:hypothetical protein
MEFALRHVLFARPQQLDRRSRHLLGDDDGLPCDAFTRGFRLIAPRDTFAGASTKALRATVTGLRDVLGARVPARAASLRFSRGRVL